MKIGRITLALDPSRPAPSPKLEAEIERVIGLIFQEPTQFINVSVNNSDELRAALTRLCDEEKCPLVLTLGGTAAAKTDIAPDVTREVADRELPGFGEIMRYYSYERIKNAALSRATAGIRGTSLIVNLPSKPKGITFCLKLLREPISEGLEQIMGTRALLREDEIIIPIEKYLPFLKRFRIKPDPRGEHMPL